MQQQSVIPAQAGMTEPVVGFVVKRNGWGYSASRREAISVSLHKGFARSVGFFVQSYVA